MDISKKLIEIMDKLQISQKEIADITEMTQGYVSMLLSGKTKNPSIKFIHRLSQLGVNADWLINGRGEVLVSQTDSLNTCEDVINLHAELSRKGYDNIAAVVVSDNSMSPTLSRGDIAVYSAGLIDSDGIYAITDNGKSLVRRLQFLRSEDEILILSDNAQFPPRRLPLSTVNDYLRIDGRVVCRILFE